MKTLQEQFAKTFVPEKSEEDKIKAIDSCIESCVNILIQELNKRRKLMGINKAILSISIEEEVEP